MTPIQKAALAQAIHFFGDLLRGRDAGRIGIPGPILPPGLFRGRQPGLVKQPIGVPGPILPPGLIRGRPEVLPPKHPIGVPGPILPPGLSRGRVGDIDDGKILPSPIERPGGPLPPTIIGGGGRRVFTKSPSGRAARLPLPRTPGRGEYYPF